MVFVRRHAMACGVWLGALGLLTSLAAANEGGAADHQGLPPDSQPVSEPAAASPASSAAPVAPVVKEPGKKRSPSGIV